MNILICFTAGLIVAVTLSKCYEHPCVFAVGQTVAM